MNPIVDGPKDQFATRSYHYATRHNVLYGALAPEYDFGGVNRDVGPRLGGLAGPQRNQGAQERPATSKR